MWTKYTDALYTQSSWDRWGDYAPWQPNLLQMAVDKINEMTAQGKTDGSKIQINLTTIRRFWLDQAAAQEWADYLQYLATQEADVLISVDIYDVTP